MLEKHDETALTEWRETLQRKKILIICLWAFSILVLCSSVYFLWCKVMELQSGFACSAAKLIGGIISIFGFVPNGLVRGFEIAFIVTCIVLFVVLLVLLLIVFFKVRKALFEETVFEYSTRFENIGLTNRRGCAPSYLSKVYDLDTVGGEIYTFDDGDIDAGKFDDPVIIRGLRNIFRGHVRPDASEVYGQIQFFVKPSAKASCKPLTAEDRWIVQHINAAGLFGAPGLGKTYGLAYLAWLNCLNADDLNLDMEMVLCDQKLTFAQRLGVKDSPSFYYGEKVLDGLETAVATLDKVKLNPDGKTRVYILDEMITFIERLERKQADRAKSLLATLVFEGREYGFKVILAGQSSHAERFASGVRDSLTSKFFFGTPSETVKHMLFPSSEIALMDAHNGVGEGYFRIDAIMPHGERFSIKGNVPDFTEIGALVRKHMQ